MLIIRTPADLVNIADRAKDSQRQQIEEKANRYLNTIREQAQQVVCSAEDMEYADGENILRLPGLLLTARTLSRTFHQFMRTPIFTWAEKRGYGIEDEIQRGPTVLWFKSSGMTCGNGLVVMLIVVSRPKRNNSVEKKDFEGTSVTAEQEPPSIGTIKSPVGGPILIDSPFECQVGDIIIIEQGEQILVKEITGPQRNPKDFCVLCVVHGIVPKGGAGKENEA